MGKFTFQCVHCHGDIEAPYSIIGNTLPCIYCNKEIIVPGESPHIIDEAPVIEPKIEEIKKTNRETLKNTQEKSRLILSDLRQIRAKSPYKVDKIGVLIFSIIGCIVSFFIGVGAFMGGANLVMIAIPCALSAFFIIVIGYNILLTCYDIADRLHYISYQLDNEQ